MQLAMPTSGPLVSGSGVLSIVFFRDHNSGMGTGEIMEKENKSLGPNQRIKKCLNDSLIQTKIAVLMMNRQWITMVVNEMHCLL